jgi:hypothetical protein
MKMSLDSIRVKLSLARRLVALRTELYGKGGATAIARQLNISARSWYNYERGNTVPGEILLRLIQLTCVEPDWLLNGEGQKFRNRQTVKSEAETLSRRTALVMMRIALELLEESEPAGQEPLGL